MAWSVYSDILTVRCIQKWMEETRRIDRTTDNVVDRKTLDLVYM